MISDSLCSLWWSLQAPVDDDCRGYYYDSCCCRDLPNNDTDTDTVLDTNDDWSDFDYRVCRTVVPLLFCDWWLVGCRSSTSITLDSRVLRIRSRENTGSNPNLSRDG